MLREQVAVKVEGRPSGQEDQGELRAKAASFALLNKQTLEANELLKQEVSKLNQENEAQAFQITELEK